VKPEKITEFLTIVGIKNANRYKRTGWVVSQCPLGPWNHENGKSGLEVFGVQIESGDPKCNCFACGFHGTLGSLVQRMFGLNKINPKMEAKWGDARAITEAADAEFELDLDIPGIEEVLAGNMKPLHEFPSWWLDTFPPALGSADACNYLQKRDVAPIVSKMLDLRWDPNQRRICFPVRDFKGRLVGLHGRAIDEEADLRYRMYLQAKKNNPIAWLGESWVNLDMPIVVVEGPFDLAAVLGVYSNATSPLFATPSYEKLRRMSDAQTWITFFDRGAGGDSGRERVNKALSKKTHLIHHLHPPKGKKDPGAMSNQELQDILFPVLGL
jgi:hypothetical protein